jgi:hypothetical protein
MEFVNFIVNLFNQHPFWTTAITTWITTTGASAFVSSLPAPTNKSTQFYIFMFKFLNRVISGNFSRANNSSVESSPNYQDAVNGYVRDKVLPVVPDEVAKNIAPIVLKENK